MEMLSKLFSIKILLVGIILLAVFLRFYQLSGIPAGITNDEADIGYDAYSLHHTGHDQWGELLPLISFKGFGDYRPPLYTYLVVPLMPVFGLTALAVRFPAALFSVISVVLLFFILRKLFSEKIGLIGGFLFAISPWSIGLSRVGIETNPALTLLLAALLCFINFSKNIRYFYLSMLFFAGTLYTYAGYTLLTPIIITALIIFYYKNLRKQTKEILIGLGIFGLLCLPLFIQHEASAKVRFSQVNFLQNVNSLGIINNLNDQRGECLKTFPSSICKVTFNKASVFSSTLITNYISHFSINFLFINGTDSQYGILPQRGLLYIFEFLLLMAGFAFIIRRKKKEGYLILALLLVSPIPDTVTGGGHYSRAFVMLPFLLSIEALGFMEILSFFDRLKLPALKKSFIALSILVALGSATMFFLTYTTYFRTFYSRFSAYGYEELMRYVHLAKNDYKKIYISRHMNDTKQYVYYLFHNAYDPMKYQQKNDVSVSQGAGGWISIDRIENIYFVETLPKVEPGSQMTKENILFISAPVDFMDSITEKKYIKDLKNDPLFQAVPLREVIKQNEK